MAEQTESEVKRTALKETLHWIVLSSLFGLLQLVMIIIFAMLLPDKELKFGDLMKNGLILFFSVSLVACSIVDYHLDEIKPSSKIIGSMISFLPIFFCLVSSCVYATIYFQEKEVLDYQLGWVEIILLLCSFVFSFFTKYFSNCYKLSI